MKLSIITDEVTQDFGEAVRFAREYGLDGLELRSVEDRPIDLIHKPLLALWAKCLREEGLKVPNIAGSFGKCHPDQMEQELDKLKRLCDTADIFQCDTIRGFGFFTPEKGEPFPLKQIAEELMKAEAILRVRKKKLLLEADPSVNTTNHRQLARLLEHLNPAWFLAIYDPGNDLFDPEREAPFPDGYRAILGRMAHIHVKDGIFDQNGAPVCIAPGKGLVPYKKILRQLKTDGYDGWLSLEPHYRKDVVLTEEQMRLPQGSSFSKGGEEAAAESIEALHRLLKEASRDVC